MTDSVVIADWGNWVVANAGVYFVMRAPKPALGFYDPGQREIREVFGLPPAVPYNHPALSVSDDGTWFLIGVQESSQADLMIVDKPVG